MYTYLYVESDGTCGEFGHGPMDYDETEWREIADKELHVFRIGYLNNIPTPEIQIEKLDSSGKWVPVKWWYRT